MSVTLDHRSFTIDEYHKMAETGIFEENERIELIMGEIVRMSPVETKHAACIKRIIHFLSRHLADAIIFQVQDPIHIPNYSEPEPDIAILKASPDFYSENHPFPEDVILLIEVADSSLKYDREIKLPLYAEAKIPEVWIVNLMDGLVEVYSRPKTSTYGLRQIYEAGETILSKPLEMSISADCLLA